MPERILRVLRRTTDGETVLFETSTDSGGELLVVFAERADMVPVPPEAPEAALPEAASSEPEPSPDPDHHH